MSSIFVLEHQIAASAFFHMHTKHAWFVRKFLEPVARPRCNLTFNYMRKFDTETKVLLDSSGVGVGVLQEYFLKNIASPASVNLRP